MVLSFKEYLRAAFSHRPWGMFVPPNWVGLAAFAMLGAMVPGFLLIGAGLEAAFLYLLATNPRFQRYVQGQKLLEARAQWEVRQKEQLAALSPDDQVGYRNLERRCQRILEQQTGPSTSPADLEAQGQGLARLTLIYLRLLLARNTIRKVLKEADETEGPETLEERITRLQAQVKDEKLSDDMRQSLVSQTEILQQRLAKQKEAREKLAFLDAEMTRIAEQVELIREQAAVAADPKSVSERIDQVAAELGVHSQWLGEQQAMYGRVDDLISEPPPLTPGQDASAGRAAVKE